MQKTTKILLKFLAIFIISIATSLKLTAKTSAQTALINSYLSNIETTPWGLVAGENDSRIWSNPYNGLFISKDFGETWNNFGLQKRGITDIEYNSFNIYATTYYFENSELEESEAGLFISSDQGKTWQHVAGNFSASTVTAYNNTVALGTYSHGLWISQNKGYTWTQKLGDGFFGPEIFELEHFENTFIASTSEGVYISQDSGTTWNEISELKTKIPVKIEMTEIGILAGTTEGLYKSIDNGETWYSVELWGNQGVGAIEFLQNKFYAARKNTLTNRFDIYISYDFGETWEALEISTIFSEGLAKDLAWAFSDPSYLFAIIPFEGVYRYEITDETLMDPIFEIPWNYTSKTELLENIWAYFDHEYPLQNYSLYTEPLKSQATTLNFLGERDYQPHMFYSSHSGTDFKLKYGTEVRAAAEGYASYGWDPSGLGNYIKINHLNGYETIYAHLQNTGLLTRGENYLVLPGQKIGQVGMTGNTSGPHLHFSVKKLDQQIPDNRIDPFGWQHRVNQDPWELYSWMDFSGDHQGAKSPILWKDSPRVEALINKEVIINENAVDQSFTVFVEPYSVPYVPLTQNKLRYLTGTSMLINLYNIFGEEIPSALEPAIIEVDISNADTQNVLANSIKIYHWDEEGQLWEAIDSVLDYVYMKVTGEAREFSRFAVFGISENAWEDKVKVLGVRISI